MKAHAGIETRLRQARIEVDLARSRAEAGLADTRRYAIADFARDLLPFKDALETASAMNTQDAHALQSGLSIALRQLEAAMARHAQRSGG